jgi:hypothetical protein
MPSNGSGKTWLRRQRCLEDINNFWMAHKPKTMPEIYSHLHEELQLRLDEAERAGYGFVLPTPWETRRLPPNWIMQIAVWTSSANTSEKFSCLGAVPPEINTLRVTILYRRFADFTTGIHV